LQASKQADKYRRPRFWLTCLPIFASYGDAA
jgi:hypothetical protein